MLGNAMFNLIGFVSTSLIMLLSYPLYLKIFDEAQFGIFLVMTGIPAFISIFGFGIFASITFFVSQNSLSSETFKRSIYVVSALCFYLLIGLLLAIGIFLSSELIATALFQNHDDIIIAVKSLNLISLTIPFTLCFGVLVATKKGMNDFKMAAFLAVSQQIFATFLPAFMANLLSFKTIGLAVSVHTFGIVILSLISLIFFADPIRVCIARRAKRKHFWAALKKLISYGLPNAGAGSITVAITQIPKILIVYWFGPAEVTIFTLAFGIASKLQAIANSVTEVIFPVVAKKTVSSERLSIYLKMFVASGSLCMFIATGLFIFTEDILRLWIGKNMSLMATDVLRWLIIAYFVSSLAAINFHFLNGIGRPVENLWVAICQFFVFIFVSVMLRVHNVEGSILFAFSFLSSHFVVLALSGYYVRKGYLSKSKPTNG